MLKSVRVRQLGIDKTYGMYIIVRTTPHSPLGKWRHALMPDVANEMSYWVVSCCLIVAQVLSVSYRADFGRRNKIGLVTANSPGTVTSPQNFGWTQTQL